MPDSYCLNKPYHQKDVGIQNLKVSLEGNKHLFVQTSNIALNLNDVMYSGNSAMIIKY